MTRKIKAALLGAGTVGSGVVEVLKMNAKEITERVGAPIELKTVLVHNLSKKRPFLQGLNITDNYEEILADDEIKVVIELMGGKEPARTYMLQAMAAGKSVVTANKDVVAEFGHELFDAAEKNDVDFQFEASVGGGIPIITPLKQCLTANRITEIMGIVNGTTNYMLTQMSLHGADYSTVLHEAQEKGYAEADPSADVDGLDAARKLAILASIAFNTRVQLKNVSVEGITNITPEDIKYARDLGYVVKLLAIGKDSERDGIDVRVHPVFLPESHPLASVNGVYNAIFVHGNAIGDAMFYGQGAGSLPTASAVVADVIDVARDIMKSTYGRVRCTCYEHKPICPLEKTSSCYYIRLLVEDKPGVLGAIATTFGKADVSLKSVIQTHRDAEARAEIVAITHRVAHAKIQTALEAFGNLDVVDKIRNVIRVENE